MGDMGDMGDITDQIPPHGRRPGPHLTGGDVKTTFITDQQGRGSKSTGSQHPTSICISMVSVELG